jgi:hypothetical protein
MLIASRLNACRLLAWMAPVLADPLGLSVGAGAGQSTLQQRELYRHLPVSRAGALRR